MTPDRKKRNLGRSTKPLDGLGKIAPRADSKTNGENLEPDRHEVGDQDNLNLPLFPLPRHGLEWI